MGFFDSLNISASALTAQRLRMDVISENIANIDTTRTANGGPYKRKMVVFSSIEPNSRFSNIFKSIRAFKGIEEYDAVKGVQVEEIIEDDEPFKLVYNPTHPDANEDGYVEMPNVNSLKETVDMMEAVRAYQASITALNAMKQMASKALEIGK